MTSGFAATNAASSGVVLDRKLLKGLGRRADRPGLVWLALWLAMLAVSGVVLHFSLGSWWVVPAMVAYGTVLTVPAYSMSHETAHGTAFRTRWLNEAILWVTSFIYFEEPYHRRYAHTSHHTHTWHIGKDAQMPFGLPMTFAEWLIEISTVRYYRYETKLFVSNALGRFSPAVLTYTPPGELAKLKRGARLFIALYALVAVLILAGNTWLLVYLVIPRLVGGPAMQLFTILQHAELAENSPSILDSTRSFRTTWPARFLYMNMHHHAEHHLYPQVPFYSLPGLASALEDQLPEPDPGLWRTNAEVLSVVLRRTMGRNTRAWSIRQAPHMITDGEFTRIANANMR